MFRNAQVSLPKQPYNSRHQQQEIITYAGVMRLERLTFTIVGSSCEGSQNKQALSKNWQVLPIPTRLVSLQLHAQKQYHILYYLYVTHTHTTAVTAIFYV